MKLKKEHINEWLDNPKRLLVGGAVVGIGGFLLYKFGRTIIASIRSNNTEKLADESPEVRQAMALRSALNPSGVSWMKAIDGTNITVIMDTAQQITKLDDVMSAYKKLYDDDLMKDLQADLNASEYQKFLTLVSSNTNKTGGATYKFANKDQLVVAKTEVTLRSSPDASYHGAVYEIGENKNIIRKAKAGEFLGYATGNQKFDEKNNVKFIEVGYLIKKENPPVAMKPLAGKKFTFWVSSSASYVEIFQNYLPMLEKYPSTKVEVAYKKPLNYYNGVMGFFSRPVVTVKNTNVLNEKMQAIIPVESQTLLGDYLMSLDTGKAKYIKFKTVDRTERWVMEKDVRVEN